MVKLKDFSKPLSAFQVLFNFNPGKFIFQGLFKTVLSSTFQACANPVYVLGTLFKEPIDISESEYMKPQSCPKS